MKKPARKTQISERKNIRLSFLAAALIFFSFLFPVIPEAGVDLNAYPDRGYSAPEFNLRDLNGKEHSLSDYRGKVVLLNVWATWCFPCLAELPSLESLNKKMEGQNFALLTVSIDHISPKALKQFVKKNAISFPVLHSPDGYFQNLYRTNSIPTTFIIDKTGAIVSRVPGAREWDSGEAVEALKELMNFKELTSNTERRKREHYQFLVNYFLIL
jgi:peroxiredoxin